MIKPVSGLCNMRCRYCFYADVAGSREKRDAGVMSLETLETLVVKSLAAADEFCAFGFQGGEPTLAGLDFFRVLIEFEAKHNARGVKIFHAIQTNGLSIDKDWAEFFARNGFLVGLSIDSGEAVHDKLRADSGGLGTHSRCMAASKLLGEAGVEYNILTVVTRQIASHPDKTYDFYRRNGFSHVQFIPCLEGFGEPRGTNPYSLGAKEFGVFLCRIFDMWYEDFKKGNYISIRDFDNYIHMLSGYPPESCALSGRCAANIVAEADGSVYPCDFYAVDQYYMGNLKDSTFDEMLAGPAARNFIGPSMRPAPQCASCEFHFICRGGCRRHREPVINGAAGLNYYCKSYKKFFAHALPGMKEISDLVFNSK